MHMRDDDDRLSTSHVYIVIIIKLLYYFHLKCTCFCIPTCYVGVKGCTVSETIPAKCADRPLQGPTDVEDIFNMQSWLCSAYKISCLLFI